MEQKMLVAIQAAAITAARGLYEDFEPPGYNQLIPGRYLDLVCQKAERKEPLTPDEALEISERFTEAMADLATGSPEKELELIAARLL